MCTVHDYYYTISFALWAGHPCMDKSHSRKSRMAPVVVWHRHTGCEYFDSTGVRHKEEMVALTEAMVVDGNYKHRFHPV